MGWGFSATVVVMVEVCTSFPSCALSYILDVSIHLLGEETICFSFHEHISVYAGD